MLRRLLGIEFEEFADFERELMLSTIVLLYFCARARREEVLWKHRVGDRWFLLLGWAPIENRV